MATMVALPEGDVVIVYDARTGAIRHIHEEVSLSGATGLTPDELTKKATTFARSLSAHDGSLATLLTTGKELRGNADSAWMSRNGSSSERGLARARAAGSTLRDWTCRLSRDNGVQVVAAPQRTAQASVSLQSGTARATASLPSNFGELAREPESGDALTARR